MALNIENIKKVRDVIAALPPERLDMRNYITRAEPGARSLIHNCGTAGCIAGWAAEILGVIDHDNLWVTGDLAGVALGLTPAQADDLFCPKDFYVGGIYTLPMAVATLDRLIETGEVKWPEAEAA